MSARRRLKTAIHWATPAIISAVVSLSVFSPAHGQSAEVEAVLSGVSVNSMLADVGVLSGVDPAVTPDSSFLISSRWYDDNDAAALYLQRTLESYGYTVTLQEFSSETNVLATGTNILASRSGSVAPETFVIICAHYDAVRDTPGADDNASGTAAVLEAARLFASVDTEKSLIFALWDTEEVGLYGSKHFASEAATMGQQIEAVVNLDMIGWDGDGDGVVEIHANAGSADLAATVAGFAQTYGLDLSPVIYNPGTGASDHAPFWSNGFQAVLLIEEYRGGDFNPYYHQVTDRVEYFNSDFYLNMASLGIASVAELAGAVGVASDVDELAERLPDPTLSAYPAPFSSTVTVELNVSQPGPVRVVAYDILGRTIATLSDGFAVAGPTHVTWDATDIPRGIYLLRLETDGASASLPVMKAR